MPNDPAHEFRARCGEFEISCDPEILDIDYLFGFLSTAYWHKALTRQSLLRAIAHSIVFGVYDSTDHRAQVGFARVTGDRTTFAYLADVFIDERHRGAGLGRWLMAEVHGHPELQGLKRWLLKTRDAQDFYRTLGYAEVADSGYMDRHP